MTSPSTPRSEIIYQGGKLRLIHYKATGAQRFAPVLLVYALIKRAFILDLEPGRSVVENLRSQGFEVFLTDWIPPGESDSWRGLESYVRQDLANAVSAVQNHQSREQISIIGYCLGGLLSLLYASLRPRDVKNLVTLTTPVDLSLTRLSLNPMAYWVERQALDFVKTFYGNLPSWLLKGCLMATMPAQYFMEFWSGLSDYNESDHYAKASQAFRLWLDSEVPVAGQLLRELMLDIVNENALVRGGLKVGYETVNLRRLVSPLLNVVAEFDTVVPPRSSLPLLNLVGSEDKRNLVFPSGHVGVALSDRAHAQLWPQIGRWLQYRN